MDATKAIFFVFENTKDGTTFNDDELISLFLDAKITSNNSEFYWFKKTAIAIHILEREGAKNLKFNKATYITFCKARGLSK
jgi:hypothetical protein